MKQTGCKITIISSFFTHPRSTADDSRPIPQTDLVRWNVFQALNRTLCALLQLTLSNFGLRELSLSPFLLVFICVISDHNNVSVFCWAWSISLSSMLLFYVIPPFFPNSMQPSELLFSTFVTDILVSVAVLFLSYCMVDWNPLWPVIHTADSTSLNNSIWIDPVSI